MIPRTLFDLTFVKELPPMVPGMEGGGGSFFLIVKDTVIRF